MDNDDRGGVPLGACRRCRQTTQVMYPVMTDRVIEVGGRLQPEFFQICESCFAKFMGKRHLGEIKTLRAATKWAEGMPPDVSPHKWGVDYQLLGEELSKLPPVFGAEPSCPNCESRIKEADAKIERQAKRIRYLEGATNHATGTPLSRAEAEAYQLRVDIGEIELVLESQDIGIKELQSRLKLAVEALRECGAGERLGRISPGLATFIRGKLKELGEE